MSWGKLLEKMTGGGSGWVTSVHLVLARRSCGTVSLSCGTVSSGLKMLVPLTKHEGSSNRPPAYQLISLSVLVPFRDYSTMKDCEGRTKSIGGSTVPENPAWTPSRFLGNWNHHAARYQFTISHTKPSCELLTKQQKQQLYRQIPLLHNRHSSLEELRSLATCRP